MSIPQISAYAKERFTGPLGDGTRAFNVYARGSGPPVVLIQELPGIGQETLRFADDLVRAGFEVWLVHLFGPIGKTSALNFVRVLCMRREFDLFAKQKASPIADWLRALCRHVRDVRAVKGVGVIGMCLTGNFAMALMADDAVLAAVASQPSLPVDDNTHIQMSPAEIAASRAGIDAKGAMRAWRFETDAYCTAERFDAIGRAFNDDRERVTMKVIPGAGHAVFTRHFVRDENGPTEDALRDLIGYFRERLA